MNRTLTLATASAIALAACDVQQTGDQTADATDVNAAAPADATDVNAAAPADANQAAASDDHQYGPAPDSLPAGAQLAVLNGDPGKEGPFTIRLRFPAGYSIAAHSHPVDEVVTVISGNVSLGMGDRLDRSAGTALGAGGFLAMKARQNHYAFTDSGATVQVSAQGPFEITYVNPADDPRTKPAG